MALRQLSELAHAPSVGMQDVPRESLSSHLGFTIEDEGEEECDQLDEQIARWSLSVLSECFDTQNTLLPEHSRLVYQLERADARSSDSDDDSESWNGSRRRQDHRSRSSKFGKTRMSIVTNQATNLPEDGLEAGGFDSAESTPRRFFEHRVNRDE